MAEGPVLLIEDDDPLRNALAGSLRRHGHSTIEARSAEEAEQYFDGGVRPGLVLLDLNLPGHSGWDLLRGSLAPAPGRAPVVIISAMTVSPRQLRESGADGYLPKPFALATFLETVKRFLGLPPDTAT
jgi:DNA-binding response OmpR family regulator